MIGSKLNVLVYSGKGISETALSHLLRSINLLLYSSFDIKTMSENDFRDGGPWESNCALLVFPGGRDKDYLSALGNKGLRRIQRYVEEGGQYLGICAGAYFACRRIVFEKGREGYEIISDRELGFFPGTARGTVFPGFLYNSENGAHAVELKTKNGITFCYYNGGCQFEFDTNDDKVKWEAIAVYANDRPAIVQGKVGLGLVTLSGVHPEYDPHSMLGSETSHSIIEILKASNNQRLELWKKMIFASVGSESPIDCTVLNIYNELPITCILGNAVGFEIGKTSNELFDTASYSKELNTQYCGKTLLYSQRLSSTQAYLLENYSTSELLPNGTILMAAEQTKGKGRGTNKWISPPPRANLQFTLLLHHKDSDTLSLLQCVMAASIVQAIRSFTNEDNLIHIKWPNDIYIRHLDELKKIGGILVNTTSNFKGEYIVLIGCGVNIGPCANISSISDVISSKVNPEFLLARIVTYFEVQYYAMLISRSNFLDTYHRLWLHSGQKVYIESEQCFAEIIGIDSYGFLEVLRMPDASVIKLQPDGNSFDIMHNLIKIKT